METKAIPLRSLDSKSNHVRPLGRAVEQVNVDIRKLNEPERRLGYVRRLGTQQSGPVRLMFSYPGLCGRFFEMLDGGGLVFVHGEYYGGGILPLPSSPLLVPPGVSRVPLPPYVSAPPLASFGAAYGSSVDLSWTYSGGVTTPPIGCLGAIVARRYDDYPFSPFDPDATVVYSSTGAAYSDTEAEDTEDKYYSAWAVYDAGGYSVTRQALLKGRVIYEDDFNRADGALTDPPYDWWGVTEGDIYSTHATNDASKRLQINTPGPGDIYVPLAATVDIWHDGLVAPGVSLYNYWNFATWSPSAGGWVYVASVVYEVGPNAWRFMLNYVLEGLVITGYIAGKPPLGPITLTVTESLVEATYAGRTLSGTPDPSLPLNVAMLLRVLTTTENIQKRLGFDNFRVVGEQE